MKLRLQFLNSDNVEDILSSIHTQKLLKVLLRDRSI